MFMEQRCIWGIKEGISSKNILKITLKEKRKYFKVKCSNRGMRIMKYLSIRTLDFYDLDFLVPPDARDEQNFGLSLPLPLSISLSLFPFLSPNKQRKLWVRSGGGEYFSLMFKMYHKKQTQTAKVSATLKSEVLFLRHRKGSSIAKTFMLRLPLK